MSTTTVLLVAVLAASVLLASGIVLIAGRLLPQKPARERSRAKGIYSKLVVILMIALNVWFTDRAFAVLEGGGEISAALVAAWFGFTTAEIGACFGIKAIKEKHSRVQDAEESEGDA